MNFGCKIGENMDDSKFNQPMPWIGIYIVTASVAISIAMAADAFLGFRYRKLWFPSKFFAFNATSLTLIAVVVKLSVDLNTAMPQRHDQLAKLSSAVLICTVMGNSMPSIGVMENKEIMMNMIALGILVITLVVNICIQLVTGAIYLFWKEHVFIMFVMLVLLLILGFSALTVPTTKHYFQLKYCKKYELALKDGLDDVGKPSFVKLRNDLMKYWIMAHTCCPQFVVGRSVTCTASGAFCLLAALTLAEAMARSYLMPWTFKFCNGESDYKWSTTLILITQTIAVGVGTIAPASRWFTAICFRCPKLTKKRSLKDEFRVEGYWLQKLAELKECPIMLRIHGRHLRKLVHDFKNKLVNACIGVQCGIVIISKLIRMVSVFFVSKLLLCVHCCRGMRRKMKSNSISSESGQESQGGPPMVDLSHFVLHLEGEEELVELMMRDDCNATDFWIKMGKKNKPKNLIKLLEKSTHEFNGVKEFDSNEIHSLASGEEPPNCWALPIVTLTSIAISLPNIDSSLVNWLTHTVHEGLSYVRLIENNLEAKQYLTNVRKAAEIVWTGVDLYHKWLDIDLRKLSNQPSTPMETVEELSNMALERFMDLKANFVDGCNIRDSPYWPVKVHAAHSMYRVSQTILLNHRNRNHQTSEQLFESISVTISDIFGACFTNLPRVITIECFCSSIEVREEKVRQSIILLGKMEKILKIIDHRVVPGLNSDQVTSISEWCLSYKMGKANTDSKSTSDLYITVG